MSAESFARETRTQSARPSRGGDQPALSRLKPLRGPTRRLLDRRERAALLRLARSGVGIQAACRSVGISYRAYCNTAEEDARFAGWLHRLQFRRAEGVGPRVTRAEVETRELELFKLATGKTGTAAATPVRVRVRACVAYLNRADRLRALGLRQYHVKTKRSLGLELREVLLARARGKPLVRSAHDAR